VASQRVRNILAFFEGHVLPRIKRRSLEDLGSRGRGTPDLDPALVSAQRTLNDYVHPNHGSHVMAIWPERAVAGRCLLEGIVAAYEVFLALPWAVDTSEGHEAADELVPLAQGPEIFERFADETLPSVQEAVFRSRDKEAERWVESLRLMVQRRANVEIDLAAELSSLRESATDLAAAAATVPLTADGIKLDTSSPEWASWIARAISFALVLSDFKYRSLLARGLSYVLVHDPLPAAACVRSALEHHAIAVDLGRRVAKNWASAEAALKNSREPATFSDIEDHVGRLLAGTRSTRESSPAWAAVWQKSAHPAPVNVETAIDSCGVAERSWYDLLSRTLHGFTYTGGDLLDTGGVSVSKSMELAVLNAIGNLEHFESTVDRIGQAAMSAEKLRRAANASPSGSLQRGVLATALPATLRPGRDVIGTGTLADPFRFRSGLGYYDAYSAWCEKERLEGVRRTWLASDVIGDVLTLSGGRNVYFSARAFDPR